MTTYVDKPRCLRCRHESDALKLISFPAANDIHATSGNSTVPRVGEARLCDLCIVDLRRWLRMVVIRRD